MCFLACEGSGPTLASFLASNTSAMEQFNTEMANLRCQLKYHQAEWVSHLSKVLSVEEISLDAQAWICFLFPNGNTTN
jgi:hypothetical protein